MLLLYAKYLIRCFSVFIVLYTTALWRYRSLILIYMFRTPYCFHKIEVLSHKSTYLPLDHIMASTSPDLVQPQPSPPHLILVCCHAIYIGPSLSNNITTPLGLSDTHWLLAPFQTTESTAFTSHVRTGLTLLSQTPSSLLVFSGSKTRPEIDKSEAQSYLDLCIANSFWDLPAYGSSSSGKEGEGNQSGHSLKERIVLEEQALDSFANLLFGMLAFWRRRREWPQKITIVTHAFKKERFLECHVPALRLDPKSIKLVGIDPDYMVEGNEKFDQERTEEVRSGEKERGYKLWKEDPLGEGRLSRSKRASRNFWKVNQEWFTSKEERKASGVVSGGKLWIDEKRETIMEEVVISSWRQPWQVEEG